jgi:hypothetical protein
MAIAARPRVTFHHDARRFGIARSTQGFLFHESAPSYEESSAMSMSKARANEKAPEGSAAR